MRTTWVNPASRRPSSRIAERTGLSSTITILREDSIDMQLSSSCVPKRQNQYYYYITDVWIGPSRCGALAAKFRLPAPNAVSPFIVQRKKCCCMKNEQSLQALRRGPVLAWK